MNTCNAKLSRMTQGNSERLQPLSLCRFRYNFLHQCLGCVEQNSGRIATFVIFNDFPSGRAGRVFANSRNRKRRTISNGNVLIQPAHQYRMFGHGCINDFFAWQLTTGPALVIPISASDPISFRNGRCIFGKPAGKFIFIRSASQIYAQQGKTAFNKMNVRIIKSR